MENKKELEKCPHCGSTEGFEEFGCGMARVRIIKRVGGPQGDHLKEWQGDQSSIRGEVPCGKLLTDRYKKYGYPDYHTLGWSFCSCLCPACGEADCKCGAKWRPGIVLDPFCGTSTTLVVAKKLGLDYIGIDIKPEYIELSKKRLKGVQYQEELF